MLTWCGPALPAVEEDLIQSSNPAGVDADLVQGQSLAAVLTVNQQGALLSIHCIGSELDYREQEKKR